MTDKVQQQPVKSRGDHERDERQHFEVLAYRAAELVGSIKGWLITQERGTFTAEQAVAAISREVDEYDAATKAAWDAYLAGGAR